MQYVLVTLIHWIVIYQLDSIICPLNKWTLVASCWGSQHKLSCYNETFAHATMTWHSGSAFVIWVQFLQHYHICRVSMHYDKLQRNVFRVPGTHLSLVWLQMSSTGNKNVYILPVAFWPSGLSFIIQSHQTTTLIQDPWLSIVHQDLSMGQVPRPVHRPPTKTIPQATHWNLLRGQIPRLIHSPHTQVCPKITHQGLTTGHHPRLVQCPWTNPSPQLMYQGLFSGHQPKLIFPWLVYNPSTKACLSKACNLLCQSICWITRDNWVHKAKGTGKLSTAIKSLKDNPDYDLVSQNILFLLFKCTFLPYKWFIFKPKQTLWTFKNVLHMC